MLDRGVTVELLSEIFEFACQNVAHSVYKGLSMRRRITLGTTLGKSRDLWHSRSFP